MEIPKNNSLERKEILKKAEELFYDTLEVRLFPNNRGHYLKIFHSFKELIEKEKITPKELDIKQDYIDNLEDWFKAKKINRFY